MRRKKVLSLALVMSLVAGMMVGAPLPVSADTGDVLINETNFPDEAFRNYVSTNIDDGDGTLTLAEQTNPEKTKNITVSELGITNLKGIEYFTNLQTLYCNKNGLTALDLSANTALQILNCEENINLATLTLPDSLQSLYCNKIGVAALDLDLTNLNNLNISNCSNLTTLDVSGCTNLEDFIGIKNGALTNLVLNPALEEVTVGFAEGWTDLSFLNGCTGLTKLVLNDGGFTTLDTSAFTSLTELHCYDGEVDTLNVTQNAALESLYCRDNKLTDVDLSSNTQLKKLFLENNQLTELDLSNNTLLDTLNCSNNKLTELDLTANSALTSLTCEGNGTVVSLNEALQYDLSQAGDTDRMTVTSTYASKDGSVITVEEGTPAITYNYATNCPTPSLSTMPVTLNLQYLHFHNSQQMQEWTSDNSLPSTPGYYELTTNINLTQEWNVPAGDVVLCLNGFDVKQTGTAQRVMNVGTGANLTIFDCGTDVRYGAWNGATYAITGSKPESKYSPDTLTGGVIYGGNGVDNGAGIYVGSGANLAIQNANILKNTATAKGAGIYVAQGGNVDFYKGCISGNAGATQGMAVYIEGTFTMHDGVISNHQDHMVSAAVNVAATGTFSLRDGEIYNNQNGTSFGGAFEVNGSLSVSGGKIYNNYSKQEGSAVYLRGNGTLSMSGGEISANTVSNDFAKGAVYVNKPGAITLSGLATISGNTTKSGNPCNVFLNNELQDTTITINGSLAAGAQIGVAAVKTPGTGSPVVEITGANYDDYSACFTSDDSRFQIDNGSGNVVRLVHEHNWNSAGYDSNENGHWHRCINEGCNITDPTKVPDYTEHSGGQADYFNQAQCEVCGTPYGKTTPDITAPTIKVKVGDNQWTEFLHTVSFGFFFNETKSVEILAEDTESGVYRTYYYKAEKNLDIRALQNVEWTEYTGPIDLNPNGKYIIYTYAADNSGNISDYYNSDGMVIYTDPVPITKNVTFVRTSKENVVIRINFNGNTVKGVWRIAAANPAFEISTEDYSISDDGTITISADYWNKIQAGSYGVRVRYNPLGMFTAQSDEPAPTEIPLEVIKADGKVYDITDISKTYDGTPVTPPAFEKYGTGKATIEYKVRGTNNYTTQAPVKAGDYTVRITVATDDDYNEAFGTRDFTIRKSVVEEPTIEAKEFNGEVQKADVAPNPLYTVSVNNGGMNGGNYDVVLTLTDSNNYKWSTVDTPSVTLDFSIEKGVNDWVENPFLQNWIYGDVPSQPDSTALFGNATYKYYNADKQELAGQPYEAGNYFIKATVEGHALNYDEIVSDYVPFTIEKREVGLVWEMPEEALEYDGLPKMPRAYATNVVTGDAVQVTVALTEGMDNINAGTFTFTAREVSDGNYKLPENAVSNGMVIRPRPLKASDFKADASDRVYIGVDITPRVDSDNPLVTLADYEVSYVNNRNAGRGTIVLTGKRNATGTAEIDFYIEKATPQLIFPQNLNFATVWDGATATLANVALPHGFSWDAPDTVVVYGTQYYPITFTPDDTDNFNVVKGQVELRGVDVTAPTGTLTFNGNTWNGPEDLVTAPQYFTEKQKVEVTAADTESGILKTEYCLAETALSEVARTAEEWTEFEDYFWLEPNVEGYLYVKITDRENNSTILNADSEVVFDNIAPAFFGITDGVTYHKSVEVTVIEEHLDKVTVNGKDVEIEEGKFTLTAANGVQTVKAYDKAGNESLAVMVSVEDKHNFVWGQWGNNSNGTKSKTGTCACAEQLVVTVPSDKGIKGIEQEAIKRGTNLELVIEENKVNKDHMKAMQAKLGKGHIGEYFEFIAKDLKQNNQLANTSTVFEIPISFDDEDKVEIGVYRFLNGKVQNLKFLNARPSDNFVDGTAYLDKDANIIYVYCNQFTTYGLSSHKHNLRHVMARNAANGVDGNSEYWYCDSCGRYFADSKMKEEINLVNTVIKFVAPVQTGDDSKSKLWLVLLSISGGILAFFKKLKKRDETVE